MLKTDTHSQTAKPILLTNIRQLLTLRGPVPRRGDHLRDVAIIEDAALLCAGGKIVAAGKRRDAQRDTWLGTRRGRVQEIDCRNGVVIPGFVDSHTHPAFMAPRLVDFEKRTAGATYEEIAAAGGGIRSSVEGVRNASRKQLAGTVASALHAMARQGTTTVEAKSGYGLSLEAEIKSLQAIQDAARLWPGTVVRTLLGAHAVPHEFSDNPDNYVQMVCEQMIPTAARGNLAEFVDVFVERGAFGMQAAEAIFEAAQKNGLGVRAHVCQLSPAALSSLQRFCPASLDHLDYVSDEDVQALVGADTVITLLPASNYFLGLGHYPPARKLIDAGVAVALATDYNPGTSPTLNMPFVLSLACTHMRMSPAESIAAATINGAHSLRLSHSKGSIEPGKDADLGVFDVRDYREIPYWFGANLCTTVLLQGSVQFVA